MIKIKINEVNDFVSFSWLYTDRYSAHESTTYKILIVSYAHYVHVCTLLYGITLDS